MAERKFSCIKQVVKTVQIPLPASFISNEISGIAEILEGWKCQYSKQLQGVVVNYKHFSLSSRTGFIVPNSPYVYYNIKASFDLFCPKVGDIIKGKIFKIFKEHIVCLIEDTINVSIHLSSDSPKDLSHFICSDREILFEISSFSFGVKKALNVTGRITHKCIQLMREFFPSTFSNLVDTPEFSNNTDEGIGTSSESADDGLLNHTLDGSKADDDVNFKKPLLSNAKSKKKSKKPKSDSESSSMDTSDVSTSDKKPKKKKKKHDDKSNPDIGSYSSANNLSSDTISCDTLIQNFSSFNHSEILEAVKEEESSFEDNSRVKKHKKKQKRDLSPSLIGELTKSNNQTLSGDMSNLDLNTGFETAKSSKKRKRESESSFMDTSEISTADEIPKKKKKRKDKNVSLEEKEIKNEFSDVPDNETVIATVLSLKKEKSSPVKASNNFVLESMTKKKRKDKKSKEKDKSKKKKGKILASGAVFKKDKKSRKKGSKKIKLDGEQSKKHKKSKSRKKDKSDKKRKTESSKTKVSDVIKSEID